MDLVHDVLRNVAHGVINAPLQQERAHCVPGQICVLGHRVQVGQEVDGDAKGNALHDRHRTNRLRADKGFENVFFIKIAP